MTMRVDYRLREEADGTRLDYASTAEGKIGLFWRMLMGLLKVFGRMQLRGFLRRLRELVEAPAQAA
jgi:hypothetical protein